MRVSKQWNFNRNNWLILDFNLIFNRNFRFLLRRRLIRMRFVVHLWFARVEIEPKKLSKLHNDQCNNSTTYSTHNHNTLHFITLVTFEVCNYFSIDTYVFGWKWAGVRATGYWFVAHRRASKKKRAKKALAGWHIYSSIHENKEHIKPQVNERRDRISSTNKLSGLKRTRRMDLLGRFSLTSVTQSEPWLLWW